MVPAILICWIAPAGSAWCGQTSEQAPAQPHAQFARLQPLRPNKPRGVPRADDRRVISGIIHIIRHGLRWRDAPGRHGPRKTLYNRFFRWSRIGVFDRIFETLAAESRATDTVMIDATHLKAHHRNPIRPMRPHLHERNPYRCNRHLLVMSPEPSGVARHFGIEMLDSNQ